MLIDHCNNNNFIVCQKISEKINLRSCALASMPQIFTQVITGLTTAFLGDALTSGYPCVLKLEIRVQLLAVGASS